MKLIEIGKIVRSQGLAGRTKVLSYLQSPAVLSDISEVFIGACPADVVAYPVLHIQGDRGSFILKLEGIEDRDAADRLKGSAVWMPAERMQALDEGEYYWQDIIGLEVITEDNQPLGKIEAIFPTGSNDVYVCRDNDKETLLPAIEQVVRKIDTGRRVMTVRLPEGLFDR